MIRIPSLGLLSRTCYSGWVGSEASCSLLFTHPDPEVSSYLSLCPQAYFKIEAKVSSCAFVAMAGGGLGMGGKREEETREKIKKKKKKKEKNQAPEHFFSLVSGAP